METDGIIGGGFWGDTGSCGRSSPFTDINAVAYPVTSDGDVYVVMETGYVTSSYGIKHFFCISFI